MFRSLPVSFSVQQVLASLALGAAVAAMSPGAIARSEVTSAASDAADAARAALGAVQGTTAFEQVPGVFRQQIGSLQVTALLDGVSWLPHATVQGIKPAQARAMLRQDFVPTNAQGMHTAVNAFLVRRGDRLMLVDAGAGQCFGPGTGKLAQNLKAAGVNPSDITDVLLTHAHPDHVCGMVSADGKAVFGKAKVWISKTEADYWLSAEQKAKMPKEAQSSFDHAVKALDPYQQADRLIRVADGDELPAGVEMIATPGHTPGHVSWLFDGGNNDKLLAWGDIIHFHAIQFEQPRVYAKFDSDPKVAIPSRQRIMARAARERWWVAGGHLPFPAIGHVATQGKAYRWVPTEFGPVVTP